MFRSCRYPDCDLQAVGKGYCHGHYRQLRLGRELTPLKYKRKPKPNNNGGHKVGEVIGNKVLVAYRGQNQGRHHLWDWKCIRCETISGPSTLGHLRRSVGCAVCSRLPENNGRWKGHEKISGTWLWTYRRGAEIRGYTWEVTPEDLWDLWLTQQGCCAYTGWKLEHGVDASLDRRENSKGYVVGNVQWVHKDVNAMKLAFSEKRFIQVCQAISDFSAGRI